ncbi:hypothetical protein CQ019_04150 [Arthrobacter sp. MYb229]|nr:hypothetical protein CQ019_04150 [Arthrobacter sp. MYb229]PRB53480.1 hypothetical protein CQ013_04150 [Arthrobacter sp. MYb216]
MWARSKHTASDKDNRNGFTIVELLIVIVVIGILAAITIVAYNGIQNRAYDTTIQSDLSSMAKSLELYKADTGVYPQNATELIAMKTAGNYLLRATRSAYDPVNSFIYCQKSGGGAYAIVAKSKSGRSYISTHSNSAPTEFAGYSATQVQVCPNAGMESTGYWGYANGTWQDGWVS